MQHSVILYRIDPARNMRRFYRLDIQPDLFGQQCLICEWGRIGRGGQMRSVPYPTDDEALIAFNKQRATKERRGYSSNSLYSVMPRSVSWVTNMVCFFEGEYPHRVYSKVWWRMARAGLFFAILFD